MKLMVRSSADPLKKNKDGANALYLAAHSGHTETALFLKQNTPLRFTESEQIFPYLTHKLYGA
jgi:hypothetical protein